MRARRITRSTPIGQALGRLGSSGFLGLAREVVRAGVKRESRSRRDAYLIERGGAPSTFDAQPQPIPIDAAAMLSGIYGFLSDIPKLTERRAALQRRRQIEDRDLIGRFGTRWLAPSLSPFQLEHNVLHSALVDEFKLGILNGRSLADDRECSRSTNGPS